MHTVSIARSAIVLSFHQFVKSYIKRTFFHAIAADKTHTASIPFVANSILFNIVSRAIFHFFRHFIDYDEFKKMSELSDEYGFALCLELSEGFFINRITPPVLDVANTLNHSVPVPADIEEVFRTYGCGQLSAYFDAETERKVMPQVPGLCASRWHPGFVNIDVAGIDKGTALKEMAGLMGTGIDETISFGDGGNDIPLIKAAGLGVAMGNAGEELKAVAGYVTASVDEDGFAAALQRFVL